jgi:GH15 family glucan-1,4-alpha-glucosidase
VAGRLEDYALVGDLQTGALVSRGGSIDWLCLPRFDSGACFAALLGTPDNGRWLLAPAGEPRPSGRRYRGSSLVLETELETTDGAVRVIDFMPPRGRAPDVVRIVEGLRGRVQMRSELTIRFDYGSVVPWVRRVGGATVAVAGPDALSLRTPVEARGEELSTVSEFEVAAGERVPFVLTWFPSNQSPPPAIDAERALSDSESFWEDWCRGCSYDGEWREAVLRSLVVLKALTYLPTGGIVAAPTTSLPEQPGGVRNWDYRYCWLRDATLTILSFLNAGYVDEAEQWRAWLLRAAAGNPGQLQIMYGVGGERRLTELELDWLPGYEEARPVRIGNAACSQFQLDVYGEVLDALYQARRDGLPIDEDSWRLQLKLLERLERDWREPDQGLWEMRGPAQHFTHSKVMAWVAFDRAVRAVDEEGLPGPVERWRELRAEIHDEVCREGFDADLGSFTQVYGSPDLDGSLLMIPLVGFLPATDARVLGTIDAVQRELTRDGLVERYSSEATVDGLPAGEGTFLACSFWLCECLALADRDDEARELFERLLDLRNDVGLLAEEYDPVAGRQLGNFPQAFSHLALIDAAFCLTRESRPGRLRHEA